MKTAPVLFYSLLFQLTATCAWTRKEILLFIKTQSFSDRDVIKIVSLK